MLLSKFSDKLMKMYCLKELCVIKEGENVQTLYKWRETYESCSN